MRRRGKTRFKRTVLTMAEKSDKIVKADTSQACDMIWCIADLYNTEKHLAYSVMRKLSKNKVEEAKKLLLIYNEVRIKRSKMEEKLVDVLGVKLEDDDWCLTADTPIITNPSVKNISEIEIGDKVLTHTGDYYKVNTLYKRKFTGNLIEILPHYTNIPIKITPNHLVFCFDNIRKKQKNVWRIEDITGGVNPHFKKAKDLTENDFLVFPRFTKVRDKKRITVKYSWYYGKKRKERVLNIKVDEKLMELIGLYISEGCSYERDYINKNGHHKKGRYTGFFFGKKEKELEEMVKYVIKNNFDLPINIHTHHRKRTIEMFINQVNFVNFFKQFGSNAKEKRIPKWVLLLPENKLYAFLKGYFLGDGYKSKYCITFSTVSKQLAFQLRIILFKLGILHSLKKREMGDSVIEGRKIRGSKYVYTICISGDSARKLAKKINIKYDGGKKTSGNFGFVDNKYVWIPIKNIRTRRVKDIYVYNIGVDKDLTYTTFTGTVHNCCLKHMIGALMQSSEVGIREQYKENYDEAIEYFKIGSSIWEALWILLELGRRKS